MTSYTVRFEWKAGLINLRKVRDMALNVLSIQHAGDSGRFSSSEPLFNHVFVQVVRIIAWSVLVLMSLGVLAFVGLMVKESIRKRREALKDDEFNASDIDIEAGLTSSYIDDPPRYAEADAAPPAYRRESEGEIAPPAYCETLRASSMKPSHEIGTTLLGPDVESGRLFFTPSPNVAQES